MQVWVGMQQLNLMCHSRRVEIALLSASILLLSGVTIPLLPTLGQVQPDVLERVLDLEQRIHAI
jgi:hypothetical protein